MRVIRVISVISVIRVIRVIATYWPGLLGLLVGRKRKQQAAAGLK